MWLAMPFVILLGFGMMPTIVAFFLDRTPQRYSAWCVGGINLCGVLPFLLDLWSGPSTPGAAWEILLDVFNLLLVYGSAGFGWMLYIGIPPVVGAVLTVIAERRIQQCRSIQAQLIEEWGKDVAAKVEEFAAPAGDAADMANGDAVEGAPPPG